MDQGQDQPDKQMERRWQDMLMTDINDIKGADEVGHFLTEAKMFDLIGQKYGICNITNGNLFPCGVLFGVTIVPVLIPVTVYHPAPKDKLLPSYGSLCAKKRSILLE
eukprot:8260439-Ditylum_brightwellii.AAC.1